MGYNLNAWEPALAKLKVGMRLRHWNGCSDPEVFYTVSIIGFSEENLGWPIVACDEYPTPVVANPVCLLPLKRPKNAKPEQDTFF